MARYRPVFTEIWVCDDKFQDYSVEGKLLFLYLITNEHLEESGIYKITYKTMANETDIPKGKVIELIKGGVNNNVSYDERNNVVFVHKFLKFSGGGNPDLIKKSIEKGKRLIKTTLWKEFYNYYTKDLKPKGNINKRNASNSNINSIPKSNLKDIIYDQAELDRLFEKWWKRYPRSNDKGKAKGKWLNLIQNEGVDPQEIEDALTGYINVLNNEQTDRQFIKHAKTFLYNGNKKKKIESTWRPFIKYSDPKYKRKPPL